MHDSTELVPGVAISPDGSQMAILYDGGNRLMTIDTVAMKVVGTRLVTTPPAPSSWFSLWPVDTKAKAEEGIYWNLAYSADGERLRAWRHQMTFDQAGKYGIHSLGMRAIDVRSASVIAQSPRSMWSEPFSRPMVARSTRPPGSREQTRSNGTEPGSDRLSRRAGHPVWHVVR